MARQINPGDPGAGYPSRVKFEQTGAIASADLTIFDTIDGSKRVEFDVSPQAHNTKLTLKSGAISADTIVTFPSSAGTIALTTMAGPAFGIVQPITGTSPTATVASDTVTYVSGDNSISVIGSSSTNTLDVRLAGSFVNTIGAINGVAKSSNGAVISTSTLYMQTADASNPGLMSAGVQTIAGAKTFSGLINADAGIDRSSSGTLAIGTDSSKSTTINIGNSSATVNIQGSTIFENTQTLTIADPTIVLNKGGAAGSASSSGITLEEDSSITGYTQTSGDRNSWTFKAPNTAGIVTLTPGSSGFTVDQASHNPVTLGAVGSSPSANGASLSTQVLTLQPADGTHPGVITSGTQTIGGAKTFNGAISASNFSGTSSGTNTGDQTITLTGDITGSGTGSFATTLATVNSNTGSFGSSTSIPTFTVNGKGLITAASGNSVVAPAGTVTGTTLASNVVTSSLTSVGTITSGTWTGTTIAVANGGTGITSGTSGGILAYTATGTLVSSGALTANQLIIGGGAGVAPSTLAAGSQYQVLRMGAANPAYGSINLDQSAAVTGALAIANGGTGQTTANAGFNALSPMTTGGDIIYGGASGVGTRLANGSSGQVLTSAGTTSAPTWSYPIISVYNGTVSGATLAATTTNYLCAGKTSFGVLEINSQSVMSVAGTIRNLYVASTAAQPGTGTFVFTVRVNGVDSTIIATISSGAATGVFSDTTHSVAVNAGDLVTVKAVNNASGTSANIGGFSFSLHQG